LHLSDVPLRLLASVERGEELLGQMAKDCEAVALADKPKREGNRVFCFLKPKSEK
jgi:translation initiation factor IF-3